jgi:hypothetical protein
MIYARNVYKHQGVEGTWRGHRKAFALARKLRSSSDDQVIKMIEIPNRMCILDYIRSRNKFNSLS